MGRGIGFTRRASPVPQRAARRGGSLAFPASVYHRTSRSRLSPSRSVIGAEMLFLPIPLKVGMP
jgi:hypothetical protein